MAKIKNPRGDGRDADVFDRLCYARPCLNVGENYGVFTQGRGYTQVHKNPTLECMTRHLHGCPYPLPEAESEAVRCCVVPDFPTPKKGQKPYRQRCRTCGEWASGWVLEARRSLPAQDHVECRHLRVYERQGDLFSCPLWFCPNCSTYWLVNKPGPRLPGKTFRQLLDEQFPIP